MRRPREMVDLLEYHLSNRRPTKKAELLRGLANSQNNPELAESLDGAWRREQIAAIIRENPLLKRSIWRSTTALRTTEIFLAERILGGDSSGRFHGRTIAHAKIYTSCRLRSTAVPVFPEFPARCTACLTEICFRLK